MQFIEQGFVRIDNAFPRELADAGRPSCGATCLAASNDPSSWTRPVVRFAGLCEPPFRQAISTPVLHRAFDQITGPAAGVRATTSEPSRWRFPASGRSRRCRLARHLSFPDDDCDPNERHDFSAWRSTSSRAARALLMLFLFSMSARTTRRRESGSARICRWRDISSRPARPAGRAWCWTTSRRWRGRAGDGPGRTVYLCHPFLVHAAQKHRGKTRDSWHSRN